ADARVSRIPHDRVGHAARQKIRRALFGPHAQLVEVAELDRLRRAGLRARRDFARLLPVVAKRALERAAVTWPPIDDAERARDDAVAEAVADVGLDVDPAEFGADDRSRRARLEAAGVLAVFADVGGEVPRRQSVALALDERDVPPRRM